MNLREPKRKHNVKLKPQPQFPIPIGEENKWSMYTAQLTYTGACLIDPAEIHAVHSMGFFGKGSLSRSYPSFGRQRYGVPAIIRNRQSVHRKEWLEQVKELSIESNLAKQTNSTNDSKKTTQDVGDIQQVNGNTSEAILDTGNDEIISDDAEIMHSPESIDLVEDEVQTEVIDSSEEDDVHIILTKAVQEEGCTTKNSLLNSNNSEDTFHSPHEDPSEENPWPCGSNAQNKLLVLPDSDSENDEYLKDIKPKVEPESYPIQETLHLTHEETFFLLFGLGCLNLVNFDGTLLSIDNAWHYFCKADKHFIQKYIVYHYFRSKGWIVKPGLKYGGDFLLYKQGPPFYHASYIVIIDVVSADTLSSIPSKSIRGLTWNSLLGLERLSETAAKEILFAQVLWPASVSLDCIPSSPDALSEFSVKELLWRRWKPKNKNTNTNEEDENSC